MNRPVSARERRFIDHYLADPTANATAAARAAGYTGADRTLRVTASRLLTRANVRSAIDAAMKERAERLGLDVSAEWVLGRLSLEAVREGEGSQHAARVRALEVLAKYLAPAPPKRVEVDHAVRSGDLLLEALAKLKGRHKQKPPVTGEMVRRLAEEAIRRNGHDSSINPSEAID